MIDYQKILAKDPIELADWILREFYEDLPKEVITTQDMENASKMLLRLSSAYSYLSALLSYAKILARQAKRSGEKETYEDMVDRKEIIQNALDGVKQQYSALSRAVTIKIENNSELRMLGHF